MEYEQYDIVKQLLDRGADVNAREYRVSTVVLLSVLYLVFSIRSDEGSYCGATLSR